jgi:hypothetical protein
MIIFLITSYYEVENFQSQNNTTSSQYTSASYRNGRKRTYHIARRMASRTDCLIWHLAPWIGLHTYIKHLHLRKYVNDVYIKVHLYYVLNSTYLQKLKEISEGENIQSDKSEKFQTMYKLRDWKTNSNKQTNKLL